MREQALRHLRQALGTANAQFRDGQFESVSALVERRARLLVVQRTGWGKSLVYFLATKFLRDRGAGCTLLISPLLSLMRNQLAAAQRIGLRAETINSSNRTEWEQIERRLHGNEIDLLLISPERLANDDFAARCLLPIANRIGLFVVDEAHCISDWGHDFRPDYRRIVRVLRALPRNVPVVATTATANNRVVQDVIDQIGPGLELQRGPLTRISLRLRNIYLPSQAERLAWIANVLPKVAGSGIVYTLTVHDSLRVANWLRSRGIDAEPYYGAMPTVQREALEQRLLRNEVKALVATVALGMGFDKPDLGFVIHFQRPASVVHYYQQVGRAGRAVDDAYGVLLNGEEDDAIAEYFIRTAFPSPREVDELLEAMSASNVPMKPAAIQQCVNLSAMKIEKCLKFLLLESPAPLQKTPDGYVLNPVHWGMPTERIARITELRRHEQQRIKAYMASTKCLMQFLAEELDDPHAGPCGRCANCAGDLLAGDTPEQLIAEAIGFVNRLENPVLPRKRWPSGLDHLPWSGTIPEDQRAFEGRALCRWGDPGIGVLVQFGKQREQQFDERLVEAAVHLIRQRWKPDPAPSWVTCVPSRWRQGLVPDFARRLARSLEIPFRECVQKLRDTWPQKSRENSFQRVRNIGDAFWVNKDLVIPEPVLLVDDMVDSRWTFTVVSVLLREAGCGPVLPFALADSSSEDDV